MRPEAERLLARSKKDRTDAEARRGRAQEFARALAKDMGRADPGVRAILGFGSTFEEWRRYRQDSDIDLAMIGGDWGKLWSLIPKSEFDVSLVELDAQPAAFVEPVMAHGVVLYEKQ